MHPKCPGTLSLFPLFLITTIITLNSSLTNDRRYPFSPTLLSDFRILHHSALRRSENYLYRQLPTSNRFSAVLCRSYLAYRKYTPSFVKSTSDESKFVCVGSYPSRIVSELFYDRSYLDYFKWIKQIRNALPEKISLGIFVIYFFNIP